MGKKYATLLLFIVIAVIALAVPYVKNEYLAAMYGYEFEELYIQSNTLEGVDYCKVLSYTDTHAKVCYVNKGESINIIEFSHIESETWQISSWKTVWTKSGSTFNFMYPIYI